ncbi:hypothetical protein ACFL5P_01200 [candidate division KSB1 bacterium]
MTQFNFSRSFDDKMIEQLETNSLYKNCIKEDLIRNVVFPAIRNNSMGFYYKGGRPFEFDKSGFKTNRKYLSLFKNKGDYLLESDLKELKEIKRNFEDQYKDIKENCAKYAGVEGEGVSYLYSKYSYVSSKSPVVVLDIEVAFAKEKSGPENGNDKARSNRIDILLYNKTERFLKFVEAKHFSNSEIWSKAGHSPKVVNQIKRYNKDINENKEAILEKYNKYIISCNTLFNLTMDEPQDIVDDCGLYIFGFDRDQLQGRFNKLLKNDNSLKGIDYYARGNPDTITAETLWNRIVL